MSWADVVIAIVVLVSTERGYSLGLLRQVGNLVGFMTGFVIGIILAPKIALHVNGNPLRPLVAGFIIAFCVFVCAVAGRHVGSIANLAMRRLNLGMADRFAGAAFAAVSSLLICWLIASLLVNVSLASLSGAIASSRILAAVDKVMPPVPSVEAKAQGLFRSTNLPGVFSSVVQPLALSIHLPSLATANAAVAGETNSIVKVTAINACGHDSEGTGFVVADGEVLTAAHVVAGAKYFLVDGASAHLIGFDPDNDVAVLATTTSGRGYLSLFARTPPTGSLGAVPGYPHNGGLVIRPAALAGTLTAQGRDIYDDALVTRQLVVVDANVEPGNSGSPLVIGGRVAGLIFSRSVAQPNVGYAVPASVLRSDLQKAKVAVTVKSGDCLSAA